MTNETVTIKVEPLVMTVVPGAAGKLWYQANGLDIYVQGSVCRCREHAVAYHANLACAERHIPLITLRDVREKRGKRRAKVATEQKGLL